MKTNESKKGISLIVLIITILVMIILAAAVILYLDDTKVVKNAKRAASENDISVAKEVVIVARAEWRTNKEKIKEEGIATTFKQYAEDKLKDSGFEIGNNGGQVEVSENGLLYAYKEPLIPEGYIESDIVTEDEVSEGLVIYEGDETVSTDEDAMETRNQFVWVPVPNMTEFVRKEWGKGTSITYTTSYNMDDAREAVEYTAMKESVAKYGGFYIARYEAGTNVERTESSGATELLVQKNKNGYNYVKWDAAKDLCATLSTDSMVGHLIYGEEWDAALNFISKTDADYAINSMDKGNYTGSLLKTGSNEDYAINNIYDMAGNVFEWTQESYSDICIRRGGDYHYDGTGVPASYREDYGTSYTSSYNGFRLALYLK